MRARLLYPTYDAVNGRGCCRLLHVKHAAITGGIYTLINRLLVILGTASKGMFYANHDNFAPSRYILIKKINIAILVVLLYSWRISVNMKRYGDLQDVYYGVQIAYFAIIGTQLFMIVLSIILLFGIYKENVSLVVPWIMGFITFTALEAVAMVYSNVLRDHVNRQFDALCKAEMAFFITRTVTNMVALYGVLRFYYMLRAGVTWKGPEAIEL